MLITHVKFKNIYIKKKKTETGLPDIENKLAVIKAEREMGTGKI